MAQPRIQGYLIDPHTQHVYTVDLPIHPKRGALPAMYKAMLCDCVDLARIAENEDLWVDDEGLLKSDNPRFAILDSAGNERHFAGRALLLGRTPGGDCASAVTEARALLRRLAFFDAYATSPQAMRASVRRPQRLNGGLVVGEQS